MTGQNLFDVDLSTSILDAYNRGEYDRFRPVEVGEIPGVDGSTVVDFTGDVSLAVRRADAESRLRGMLPDSAIARLDRIGRARGSDELHFDRAALDHLGLLLMPRVAYGVLNGGSATSYADRTKNTAFSAELTELWSDEFARLAELSEGKPKGVTPAFLQPNGELGPSFLMLKMRNLLLTALRSRVAREALGIQEADDSPSPLLPFFQMTSHQTHDELERVYRGYRDDPMIRDLIAHTGLDATRAVSAVQPLICAFTHSEEGRPKRIFEHANGTPGETLPLPGGHGQSFAVLKEVYQNLYAEGKRFAYLGNVDNLGFVPDPAEVAWLALTGKQAGFDFAFKTPVDVKGGILVRDTAGRLHCADIGPAISKEDVHQAEEQGKPILFNAATGLFSLEFLTSNIDRIARELPTRFTDQDKDAGRYSQAEQVTWEVIGMLDDFLVFSVTKWNRLLAAKLLNETLMTSGIKLDDPGYPTSDDPATDLRGTARKLHAGLVSRLETDYAMRRDNGRWVPLSVDEILRGAGSR